MTALGHHVDPESMLHDRYGSNGYYVASYDPAGIEICEGGQDIFYFDAEGEVTGEPDAVYLACRPLSGLYGHVQTTVD
ncbi:hypothetical protein J8402_04265 [Chromohalobacter israelensis]|nr:hypothetical protein [Chromohalobacter salexigens]